MSRRVVVTGLGALSPVGNSVEESWRSILSGKSGIRIIDFFDVTDFASKISGTVRNVDFSLHISTKDIRKTDLFIQYAIVTAKQALEDSKLSITDENAGRVGIAIGSGICGLPYFEKTHTTLMEKGPRRISPFFIPAVVTNMSAGHISILTGAKGPSVSITSACATGTHNIGLGARIIAYGDADVMFCGGTEMATSPLGLGGFAAMHALSTRNDEPEKACRPWDKDRDGFVLADGAGILVLEELEHAKKRGAYIYGEVIGFGMSGDAYHITLPEPEGRGASAAMSNALCDAKLNPEDIDYINAHGTSTPAGDEIEVRAVKNTFGDHAYKLSMSSTKSMTGHLLGATGAVEAIFSLLALRDQVAPPTINLDNPSDGCDLNFVPHTAQEQKIDVVLSNSFGFGGTNATVIFKKFSG
ncbi:MAG: beta-ketoacyl-[acyl-carrier-protein] synthase II [Gammaproteobacteria bacterium RIFCSPHIGHO2_02_FULL_42_13]|nr:MAG: beta-ketoacyl-[acyl-carrier-protein] synthase II [Gammaproteobacteria bacterium RIFCSPHIGHO2_02_FULL_42_13]OGT68562.1 MAG: beta-ketoacyl-[acyl-carrier-protein] synthase II [Gammaproteobacteria bacterium RIFCSPLOWO2_02_FULL_42_9]